jgi:hypothetical protein
VTEQLSRDFQRMRSRDDDLLFVRVLTGDGYAVRLRKTGTDLPTVIHATFTTGPS